MAGYWPSSLFAFYGPRRSAIHAVLLAALRQRIAAGLQLSG